MLQTEFDLIKERKFFDKQTKDKIMAVLNENKINEDFLKNLESVIQYMNYDTKVFLITEIKRHIILNHNVNYVKIWFFILRTKKECNLFNDFIEFYLFQGKEKNYEHFIINLFDCYGIQYFKYRKEFNEEISLKTLVKKIDELYEITYKKEIKETV